MKIITWPAEVLETKAEPVSEFDADLKHLVNSMQETMLARNGIGLSANQVNVLKRIAVVRIPYHEADDAEPRQWWHDKDFVLINPEFSNPRGKVRYMEGCLSFPEMYGHVSRSANIKVKAQDVEGKFQEFEADGLLSICIQHEIDHLDGIVFTNHMSRIKAEMIKKKLRKRKMHK